jgi:hypothetical protein
MSVAIALFTFYTPLRERIMSHYGVGLDQENIQIIEASLESRFVDIAMGEPFPTKFTFTNGTGGQSWQLVFNGQFLEEVHPAENLRVFMETTVIPVLLDHPDRRIVVEPGGAITITELEQM